MVAKPKERASRHLLIRASAGTGKTFQLSNRFLALLRGGVPHERLMATTFTRKAAGEILDRVILRLAEATQDEAQRQELERFTGGPVLSRAACLQMLQQAMRQLHRLRVSTLDSFFSQLARSFSLELGLPPGWQIIEDWQDTALRSQAISALLDQEDPAQLRTLLNLLAKGETDRSIGELVRQTVQDLYDLFQDTAPAAWQTIPHHQPLREDELAAVLEELRTAELPTKQMLKGRDQDYDRAVRGDWEAFLGKGLAAAVHEGTGTYHSKPIPEPVVAVYQRLLDHVRAELVGRVALQTEATYTLLQKFHGEYQRRKQRARAARFADITRSLQTLGQQADPTRLMFRLDSHIDHLLLDEFQDTAPEQWRVVQPLAERVTAAEGDSSLFCVGDVKQAIYGWRGGVAEIFDAIADQLGGLGQESLNTSYRSSPAVIETVNHVFANLTAHPNLGRAAAAVRRWCAAFPAHTTARADLAGYVELVTAPRAADGQSQTDVTLAYAADRIAALVAQAPGFRVAALARKNTTVGQLIFELRRRQINASEEGGNPLTDSAAVLTVLSALRMTDHPGDSVARFHLATGPLGAHLGVCTHTDDAAVQRAAQAVRRALLEDGYGPTIQAWAAALAPYCSRREWSRLEQLIELAYGYQDQATLRAADFVAYVQKQRVSSAIPADVRVMTIHQAKGLEFDIVFLPELDTDVIGQPPAFVVHRPDPAGAVDRVCRYANAAVQTLLPPAIQQMFEAATDRSVTEALCVLYVALTRAAHALHAIIAPSAENERSLRCSYAGLLRAALRGAQPAAPESVVYQHGDAAWHQHPRGTRPRVPVAAAAPSAGPAVPVTIRLAPLAGPRRRGWERARPSGLEGGTQIRLPQVLRAAPAAALFRGQLIHAWFEQIGWLDEGAPDDATLRRVAEALLAGVGAGRVDLAEQIRQFRAMLTRPAVTAVLSRRRYDEPRQLALPPPVHQTLGPTPLVARVQNERGFAFQDGEQLLTGFVDRLVLLEQHGRVVAAEVLDFKTDALAADDAEQVAAKVAHYQPQLAAYRRAVAQFAALPLDHIAAQLVFVEAGLVRPVAPADTPAGTIVNA